MKERELPGVKIRRYRPGTNEEFVPYRYRDGSFRLADPSAGAEKHHAKNAIKVYDETELKGYIDKGYHLRMEGLDTGHKSLISPKSIVFEP
ncbi:MAG: hypothetical protein Kow00114_27750 [Kiloniellaceae bacterium]